MGLLADQNSWFISPFTISSCQVSVAIFGQKLLAHSATKTADEPNTLAGVLQRCIELNLSLIFKCNLLRIQIAVEGLFSSENDFLCFHGPNNKNEKTRTLKYCEYQPGEFVILGKLHNSVSENQKNF